MTQRSLINRLARFVSSAMVHTGATHLTDDELQMAALVVAPHPDDETLGCGGTILRKLSLGANAHVVLMTDGSGSHRGMPPQELVQRRSTEARAACAALGIDSDRVTLLAFPDGRLSEHESAAASRLTELLQTLQPKQVFAPYRHDNHPDHLATTRAVVSAIGQYSQPCKLLEYPVWFWEHWPWMEVPPHMPHRRRRIVSRALRSPWRGWLDFNRFVDVTEQLDRKRIALDKHATQMTAMSDGWTTLQEISGGAFLERLLTNREIFAERKFNTPSNA